VGGRGKIIKFYFVMLAMYFVGVIVYNIVGVIVYNICWFLFRIVENLNWSPMVEMLVSLVFLNLKYMVMY